MFSRRLRLSRQAIADVSSSPASKRASSEHFSVVYGARADGDDGVAGSAGCAVVVSKKIAKTSVGRHLLKRRIRAAISDWCQNSYALIIYARAGSAELPFPTLVSELTDLLPRVGAYSTI